MPLVQKRGAPLFDGLFRLSVCATPQHAVMDRWLVSDRRHELVDVLRWIGNKLLLGSIQLSQHGEMHKDGFAVMQASAWRGTVNHARRPSSLPPSLPANAAAALGGAEPRGQHVCKEGVLRALHYGMLNSVRFRSASS